MSGLRQITAKELRDVLASVSDGDLVVYRLVDMEAHARRLATKRILKERADQRAVDIFMAKKRGMTSKALAESYGFSVTTARKLMLRGKRIFKERGYS